MSDDRIRYVADVVALLAGAAAAKHGKALRLWGLRTLAHGGPVMMNVTLDNGTVKVAKAKFGYFHRCTSKGPLSGMEIKYPHLEPASAPRWQ